MELELYWFDKNWKQRGEGRNAHLIIDYNRRTYKYFTSYTLNGYDYNAVQGERKGDLEDYMKKLDEEDFICIDQGRRQRKYGRLYRCNNALHCHYIFMA